MRKVFGIILVVGVLLINNVIAQAALYSFEPTPVDLYELQHGDFYVWSIEWTVPKNIQSAYFTIDGINNNRWWDPQDDNSLYIHLLDNPLPGIYRGRDTTLGNEFIGQGTWLVTYKDTNGGSYENWRYNFTPDELDMLKQYGSDGIFGFGIDPDCQFTNKRIAFTAAVPEPMSILLFGPALLGLVGLRRKKL
ncbi:MAG: PEP-CTERM sorting domain-containing protein [Candidatus Omnitrophica bacterium]|nr:PEP-CTERM sorting domain-containing protein [Candidatus Omnitrophota bacterium]